MQVARVAPDWPVPSLMHTRRGMGEKVTYVGLDVHKDGIVVAVAEGGLRGEVRDYGRIANTPAALERLGRQRWHEAGAGRVCYVARASRGRRRPASLATRGWRGGSAMRPARAATASNVTCRRTGGKALWWGRR